MHPIYQCAALPSRASHGPWKPCEPVLEPGQSRGWGHEREPSASSEPCGQLRKQCQGDPVKTEPWGGRLRETRRKVKDQGQVTAFQGGDLCLLW